MKFGLSNRQYHIVAKAIRNADLPPGYRDKLATEIADAFLKDNQFFDRKRFLAIVNTGESTVTTNALRERHYG